MKRGTIKHPKTDELMEALDITRREALGILTMLWDWAGEYAPFGDVGKFSNKTIARALEWPDTDADRLINALVDSRWMDAIDTPDRLRIHDWEDHREQWVDKRIDRINSEKKRAADAPKKIESRKTDIHKISSGLTAPALAPAPALPLLPSAEAPPTLFDSPQVIPEAVDNPKPRKRTERDDLWDAVAEAVGWGGVLLNDDQAKLMGRTVKFIRQMGGTAKDVPIRAKAYRAMWPGINLTAPALTKHWHTVVAKVNPDNPAHDAALEDGGPTTIEEAKAMIRGEL